MLFLRHVDRKGDLEKGVVPTGRYNGKRDMGRQRLTYLQSLMNAPSRKVAKM